MNIIVTPTNRRSSRFARWATVAVVAAGSFSLSTAAIADEFAGNSPGGTSGSDQMMTFGPCSATEVASYVPRGFHSVTISVAQFNDGLNSIPARYFCTNPSCGGICWEADSPKIGQSISDPKFNNPYYDPNSPAPEAAPTNNKPPIQGNATVKAPSGPDVPKGDYPGPKAVNPSRPQKGSAGTCTSTGTRAPLQGQTTKNFPWLVTGPRVDPVYGYFNIYTLNMSDGAFTFSAPSSSPTNRKIRKQFPSAYKSLTADVEAVTPGTDRKLIVTTLYKADGSKVTVKIPMPVTPSATKCKW